MTLGRQWRPIAGAWPLLLVLAVAIAAAPAAWGQETEPPPPEPAESEDAGTTGFEGVEDILRDEEEMLSGDYSYDPGNRRDPFKSLLEARLQPALRGPRPEGIPGLLIEEIDLTGIFVINTGPVAQVQAADRDQSFLLRIGDQLFDGDVVSISEAEVTFRQIVDDPTALKPFREVVKKLNP